MASIIIAPGKYVQGKGELKNLGNYVSSLGNKPFILVSASGMKRVKEPIEAGFSDSVLTFETFGGECSKNEIDRLIAKMGDCDVIIGVGGGKIIVSFRGVNLYVSFPDSSDTRVFRNELL